MKDNTIFFVMISIQLICFSGLWCLSASSAVFLGEFFAFQCMILHPISQKRNGDENTKSV